MHRVLAIVALLLLTASIARAADNASTRPAAANDTVRVMTFNLWVGGEAGGQPLERSADVIRAAAPDVVGLQEAHGEKRPDGSRPDNGAQLAEMLGWQHQPQSNRRGILTPHRILEATPGGWGALIETAAGRRFLLFNAHFNHAPYQPYQLLGIPYADAPFLKTANEAVAAARAARGHEVAELLEDLKATRRQYPDVPVFLTGDFNEPSFQDWVEATVEAGVHPLVVEFPTTKAIVDAGFFDTYRTCYPDVVRQPGFTWTPTTTRDDPRDHHDRIDFVFAYVPGVSPSDAIVSAEVVGESPEHADVVVTPWPSDHRAVVATVRLGGSGIHHDGHDVTTKMRAPR